MREKIEAACAKSWASLLPLRPRLPRAHLNGTEKPATGSAAGAAARAKNGR